MSIDINGNEIINSEGSTKNIFKEKLGELISLDINKINISEFNTRCRFIDNLHVKTLMASIEKHGYIPKSAVWVNAVTDNGTKQGNIIQYRLVAGRHRYEACRRIELKEIPCQLHYNLTDEEECELDRIDNELDEHHKPFHFLEEAEHYKYLRDIKGWSQRQIAKSKNVSKGIVHYRCTIADLSEEVKAIIRGAHHGGHFVERYMRELLKLSSIPYQIKVCKEIIGDNTDIDAGTVQFQDQKRGSAKVYSNSATKVMTQSDVEARVAQLLALEQEEKIAKEALSSINDKAESENIPSNSSSSQGNNVNNKVKEDGESGQVFFEDYPGADIKVEDKKEISKQLSSSNKPVEEKETKSTDQQVVEVFAVMSEDREDKGVRFGIRPLWIKHTGLVQELSIGAYLVLLELIENDFRFKAKKDSFFFINLDDNYENCYEYLAHIGRVVPVTLVKKVLPELESFVTFKKNDDLKFKIKWEKLYEIYKNNAHRIPFSDGGLKNIPVDYTGWVRPTPYHRIYIKDGVIKNIDENGVGINTINQVNEPVQDIKNNGKSEEKVNEEVKEKKVIEPIKVNNNCSQSIVKKDLQENNCSLVKKLKGIGVAEDKIKFCLEHKEVTENVLKHISELKPQKRERIENMGGYAFTLIKDGFTPPEGFVTVKEVEEKREKRKNIEEFGEEIRIKFEEGEVKYFVPEEGVKLPLSIIPNNHQFLYKNRRDLPVAGIFSDWMDNKYFT